MKTLAIAPDVTTPIELVTEKLAFLGRTGSGKTYGAQKVAELMLEAGAQIIALDPVGPWHGLRVAGKGPAFDIPVFGGLKGDVPLEPSAGVIIADLVCDRGISAVLDVSQMTHSEQLQFANDFGTRLFQRKKASPSALHLFIEECQEFIPQNPGHGNAPKCLSTYQRIVKLGRNFGIGCSLITQRPQAVSKEALNMTEVLFAFQMTGPQERATMVKWMGELGDRKTAEEITNSLPKLFDHHCIIWSPSWLKISLTTRVNEKRTADVSSTPKVGAKSKVAQTLTPIDLEALRETMAATIEKAKADDPAELRKEIAALKKQLAANHQPARIERVDIPRPVPFVPDEILTIIGGASAQVDEIMSSAHRAIRDIKKTLDPVAQREIKDYGASSDALNKRMAASSKSGLPERIHESVQPRKETLREKAAVLANPEKMSGGERKILIALAQYPDGRTKSQLAILCAYAHNGGGFNNYLGALRGRAWIEGGSDLLRITDSGVSALGHYEPLPTGADLLAHWLGKLSRAERAALEVLSKAYPDGLSKEEIAKEAGYEANGGGFNNALGKLRTLELITRGAPIRMSGALS